MTAKNLLASVAHSSDDTEFYTPMPSGYRPGKTRYVGVFGTVMSGLGKGIFASSLAKVLKDKGLTVAPIKLEGYLNLDSGTLNPFRHGEVFVLDDGMECDMDLGTYERMLDQNMSRKNFSTSGQIFTAVLEKERRGGYLGRDVQMIPHVTGEVKRKLRELAVQSDADVVFIEIGGTVGDVENAYFIEALRQLAFEEGPQSACWVALTYVLEPPSLGEQKSKAAQLGIKQLTQAGIQPHIIACRAKHEVTQKAREKIAMYSSVPYKRVFSMHDCESVYVIPEMIRQEGLDQQVVGILGLEDRLHPEQEVKAKNEWDGYLTRLRAARDDVVIGVAGKYTSVRDSYASVIKALEHAGTQVGVGVNIEWLEATEISEDKVAETMRGVHGLIVPGGFGSRGIEGKIAAISHARKRGVPFLGLCLGFQLAVIEFARNVGGLEKAGSTEFDEDCENAVIDILPEQKEIEGLGGNMRLGGQDVVLSRDTLAARLFNNAAETRLRFRHRYEVDPRYIDSLEAAGLIFSGRAPDYPIMQILELPTDKHPYFVATQAHSELTSRPLRPDPLFLGLVQAAQTFKRASNQQGAAAIG